MKTDRFLLLSSCFFLSGGAGLVYQTAWIQQFTLVFGASELALVTVLSSYMGGLALGAWLAARWVSRVRRPVLTYGLLELGIALAALGVPIAITAAGRLQTWILGTADLTSDHSNWSSTLFYLLCSGLILLVPTALMGATLPLLARHAVHRDREIGTRIGLLYTANTAGAAAGALATAFLFLPRIGLGTTIWIAAAMNLLVFIAAVFLARGNPRRYLGGALPLRTKSSGVPWILPAMLVSGTVSFCWEVLWTRLLTSLLGGSIYAFATMLASFLIALALGSALAAVLATSRQRARQGFALAQILIAGLSLAAFAAIDYLPALMGRWVETPGAGIALTGTVLTAHPGIAGLLSAAFLLPGGMAIGSTFPFAVRILAKDASDAAAASARTLVWNTLGAIGGTFATGYIVLPQLRFAGTAAIAAALSLLLAVAATLVVRPRRHALGAVAVTGLLVLLLAPPTTPWRMLRYMPLTARNTRHKVIYYGVGRSATVMLHQAQGEWRLTTNGLPEASIQSNAYRAGRHLAARWLGLLPLALRPETGSLLVVGLGAGVTVENIPASVRSLHVVELEREVVRANQHLAGVRRHDPLADPRLRLHIDDARGALRLTRQRFDAIVSQPSHPWTSGASNLYTREFFALVRERLEPSGVFVLWMGLHFVDEDLMRSLVATAADVFPYVELYQPGSNAVLIIGSARPFDVTATAEQAIAGARLQWREIGVLRREDILAARVLDNAGARLFAQGAPCITDSRNLLRMRSPAVMRNPVIAAGPGRLLAPFEPNLAAIDNIDHLYMVRRLIRQGAIQRARRLAGALSDPADQQAAIALVELARGRRPQARRALDHALQLNPSSGEARAALLELSRVNITSGLPFTIPTDLTPEQAMIVEGWRLNAAGDWQGVRRLESRLDGIEPRHPLYPSATRLRARWRIASENDARVREALDLLLPLLAPAPRPRDLLLRARAGATIGESHIALGSISEVLMQRRGLPPIDLVREARNLLKSLPEEEETKDWREQLMRRVK